MDTVPYAFIDSVAHQLSKDSASTLGKISNKQWSKVGSTHHSKRRGLCLSVSPTADSFILSHILNDPKYSKIGKIALIGSLEENSLFVAEIKKLRPYLKRNPYQVEELLVTYRFRNESNKLSFLWRLPVKRLCVDGLDQTGTGVQQKIFEYHIQSNPNLEELTFGYGSYDTLKLIIEAWKSGQSKLKNIRCSLWLAEEWTRLEDLGFRAVDEEGQLLDLTLKCAKTGRSLCIKPTNWAVDLKGNHVYLARWLDQFES